MKSVYSCITEASDKWDKAVKTFLKRVKPFFNLEPHDAGPYTVYSSKNCPIEVCVKNRDYVEKPIPRGQLMPMSNGYEADVQVRLLDNIKNVKAEFERALFDEFKKEGFREANNWNCAQWGTWKFIPRSPFELDQMSAYISTFMKHYKL